MTDNAIERITKMEEILDKATEKLDALEKAIEDLENYKAQIDILEDYYSNGEWMKDFKLDEEGKLPYNFKRGVLSEDAVYDLLGRKDEIFDLLRYYNNKQY